MSEHDHGHFSEGQHQHHDAESDRVGSFAEGQAAQAGEPMPHMGHFSEGQEHTPHTADKDRHGGFAD